MNIKKIVKALLCASNGSEEIETVNLANNLVREGLNEIIAKVSENTNKIIILVLNCAHGMKIIADKAFDDCKNESWDLILLPGGKLGAVMIYKGKFIFMWGFD